MKRRNFVRLFAGAGVGAVFVPKFERWFQPNRIWQPEAFPIQRVEYNLGWSQDWFKPSVIDEIVRADLKAYTAMTADLLKSTMGLRLA